MEDAVVVEISFAACGYTAASGVTSLPFPVSLRSATSSIPTLSRINPSSTPRDVDIRRNARVGHRRVAHQRSDSTQAFGEAEQLQRLAK